MFFQLTVFLLDLVNGKGMHCLQDLNLFLTGNASSHQVGLTQAFNSSFKYRKHYFGLNYSREKRIEALASPTKRARKGLDFWGYSQSKLHLSVDCLDMAWRKQIRAPPVE
jgi:hypothetical protein